MGNIRGPVGIEQLERPLEEEEGHVPELLAAGQEPSDLESVHPGKGEAEDNRVRPD